MNREDCKNHFEFECITTLNIIHLLKSWSQYIASDSMTVWFASRNPTTPWHVKIIAMLMAAYVLSPIDLIPDFIPFFGYLDDLILLRVMIWLTTCILPTDVLIISRKQAVIWIETPESRPYSKAGAVLIVMLWSLIGAAI
jgi:uncharacterized membrane protein YkvA (DUF1232 family)